MVRTVDGRCGGIALQVGERTETPDATKDHMLGMRSFGDDDDLVGTLMRSRLLSLCAKTNRVMNCAM